jgi:hypothetical protein
MIIKKILMNQRLLVISLIMLFVLLLVYCSGPAKINEQANTFRNLSDAAQYVGMNTCRQCHSDIYNTYIETGMGQSFDHASKEKSSGDFSKAHTVYDHELDLYYSPFWKKDSLWLMEYRLQGKDTVHKRVEQINYIIGSGHHTNSHLINRNGYIFQAPITFYTQKGQWDLPPGFENGFNSRFSRLIGLECMSCHNAYPQFVPGSENKFSMVPNGIDCERCHGPGSIHVEEKQRGILIDTSKYIDYSIVNPGKLKANLQFEICQRCHLQGNTVLNEGESFYDFKPGRHLHEVMSVFLPRYADDETFIMASHADRFKMSKCFTSSMQTADTTALRPYKNALTCVSCHNPHVSVKKTDPDHFNKTCRSCHDGAASHKPLCSDINSNNDCVSCHMPLKGSIDIPHVSVHDHYIRKDYGIYSNMEQKGKFLGLQSVNNPAPSAEIIARAYLQQFEKFEPGKKFLLDSAWVYLNQCGAPQKLSLLRTYVYYHFLRNDFISLIGLEQQALNLLSYALLYEKNDFENKNAWLAYRFGEAFQQTGMNEKALQAYQLAAYCAPHFPDFQNKLAAMLIMNGDLKKAESILKKLLNKDNAYAPAMANLGYIQMLYGNNKDALDWLNKAIGIQPDYEIALFNKAGVLIALNRSDEAKQLLQRMKIRFPDNPKIEMALSTL